MGDQQPNFSLSAAKGRREKERPLLFLVKHFQITEASYMKPPMDEQLLEPDDTAAVSEWSPSAVAGTTCVCNTVCTCVPVASCACNSVCTCNTVNRAHGQMSTGFVEDATKSKTTVETTKTASEPKKLSGTRLRDSRDEAKKPRSSRSSRSKGTRGSGCYGGGGGYGGYWAPCF